MPLVKDLLAKRNASVVQVGEQQSVMDAARLMKQHRIGCVVVTHKDRVVGIFTERDILMRVVAEGRDPNGVPVAQVMSTPVAVCTPETTVDECTATITEKRHRHLPVVERGQLVGLISSGDLLANQVREHETTITYLKEYMYSSTR